MKKEIYLSLIAILILVCATFLAKSLNDFILSIALAIPLYIVLLILLNVILGYSNLPKWLFRLRFVIYSFVYGLGFGIGMYIFNLIEKHHFDIIGIIFYTIGFSTISYFGGIISNENYYRFKKLIRRTGNSATNDLTLTDSAYYEDSELIRTWGRLILENNRLYFYSAEENKCLFDTKLSDIDPVVEKSSILKIPKGLDFFKNETKIYMKLPYYWLNVIENAKTNTIE